MNFQASPNCMKAATAAANGNLTTEEVMQAFDRIDQYRARLEAQGNATGRAAKIARFAEDEAQRSKIAAAVQKRNAALNIIVRKRVEAHVEGLIEAGVKPQKAMLAVLEGTSKGVKDGRKSVAATVQAYEAKYLGTMLAQFERERPHLIHMLRDDKFDRDVMAEMMELRDGGQPGKTGNKDAQYVAKTFASYAEMSRTDLNRMGASIGKLDGWAGPQTHDDIKMIQAGRDAWVGRVVPLLDIARTFPEGLTSEEAAKALGDIYDTIITGISNAPSPGGRVNPANLARSLGKSRVLHFRDADSALAYRDQFGYSNTVSGMFSHLRRSAKVAGAMEMLGPNPENMFGTVADGLKRRLKSSSDLTDRQKNRLEGLLTTSDGALKHAIDIATGLNSRPVNVTMAKIGSDIRAQQSMAKLGAALFSSLGDTVTTAAASQFRGSGFLKGIMTQWAGVMRGRPKGEQAEIAYLIGEGFDGLIGHITQPMAALDGPVGMMGRWQEKFFRWNGLTWWTDVNRAVAARTIAAELGMRLTKGWDELPPAYRHVLEMHGFDDPQWRSMQKAAVRFSNGKPYLTPDAVRNLNDEDVARLGDKPDDARRNLELNLLRFYADETANAVIEPDARSRRTATLGTRPGTPAGEAARLVMQFKSYPIAFTQRVGGRALFGNRKDASYLERAANIGTLLAGLTVAGYMSMTAKDMLKGYWPPRDPADWRTIMAAAQQGGAWGIYSDFLFAQTNRYGGSFLSTAVGPTLGNVSDILQIILNARDAALSGGQNTFGSAKALSVGIGNIPYANLYWVKPALDFLFLNALRDAASPGYLKRQAKGREKQYDQTSPIPPTLAQAMGQ